MKNEREGSKYGNAIEELQVFMAKSYMEIMNMKKKYKYYENYCYGVQAD